MNSPLVIKKACILFRNTCLRLSKNHRLRKKETMVLSLIFNSQQYRRIGKHRVETVDLADAVAEFSKQTVEELAEPSVLPSAEPTTALRPARR